MYAPAKKLGKPYQDGVCAPCLHQPRTILLGFSKGGTVLNQLLTEIAFLDLNSTKSLAKVSETYDNGEIGQIENQIIPSSNHLLLDSISEIHFVDVGINCAGTYLTDPDVIQRISKRLLHRAQSLDFVLHGIPRQWCDRMRLWIREEKYKLVQLLKSEAESGGNFSLIDNLFKKCKRYGEVMVSEGLITKQDIEDAKSNKGNGKAICTGLAAYGILQSLLRSAKYNSTGILLADNATEITPSNRPRDAFFDWFLNPLLIIKEQIKAEHLSPSEEVYLGKLVLLSGNPERLKNSNIGTPPESELKRAELDGLARRLHGITKSISRYPTYKRRFDSSIRTISDELAKKSDNSNRESTGSQRNPRSKSTLTKIFSQKSFKGKPSEAYVEAQPVGEREIIVQ